MDEYMLIFRHQNGKEVASPEQIEIWMKQTMDWIGGIAAQNKFVRGEGLYFEDARVVWHNNVVTNGPFGIAYWHTQKADTKEKWDNVLQLYNRLLQVRYTPIAALNRTIALAKVYGKQQAIQEAEKLNLKNNRFYFSLLGELYSGIDNVKAKEHFSVALQMAPTTDEKNVYLQKLSCL
jgi:hypothetical protein